MNTNKERTQEQWLREEAYERRKRQRERERRTTQNTRNTSPDREPITRHGESDIRIIASNGESRTRNANANTTRYIGSD